MNQVNNYHQQQTTHASQEAVDMADIRRKKALRDYNCQESYFSIVGGPKCVMFHKEVYHNKSITQCLKLKQDGSENQLTILDMPM